MRFSFASLGRMLRAGPQRPTARPMFHFEPRWKEELVVTGPNGAFTLDLWMGVLTASLPTEARWREVAPRWAADLWPVLKAELEEWCKANDAGLDIDARASVRSAG